MDHRSANRRTGLDKRRKVLRSETRPSPAEWPDSAPMSLAEAVAVFGIELPITVSLLRTEIRAGRLAPARVAGKFFVTPDQLRALFQPRLAGPKTTASTSDRTEPKAPSTPSSTDRASAAQAAALAACRTLREISRKPRR